MRTRPTAVAATMFLLRLRRWAHGRLDFFGRVFVVGGEDDSRNWSTVAELYWP